MPEMVKPEIRNAAFLNRRVPCAVGHLPRNRRAAKGKAERRMLATLSFQHHSIRVQRLTQRRALLVAVEPNGLTPSW